MHPSFLSVSPRLRLFFVAVLILLGVSGVANAISAPEVVLEDTLVLGYSIRSVYLDTTHFFQPVLLVTTFGGSDSASRVLRIRTDPLEVIDTVARHKYANSYFARAGFVDQDPYLDYATALGSDWNGLEVKFGPSYIRTDTLFFPRPLQALLIDDSTPRLWVGYIHDTSYVTIDGGYWYEQLVNLGAILQYDSLSAEPRVLDAKSAGLDLRLVDVDNNGSRELVTFWREHWYFYIGGSMGAPQNDWFYAGVSIFGPSGDLLLRDTLRTEGSDHAQGPVDFGPYLRYCVPVPIADLTGNGFPEAVVSSIGAEINGVYDRKDLVAYSLADMHPAWSLLSDETYNHKAPFVSSLWPIDDDSLLDVLVLSYPWELTGYKGNTGETLFVTDIGHSVYPMVTGELGHNGEWRGIAASRDTLFRFRLDFAGTGVGGEGITPEAFELYANFPNPFNAGTEIEFSLAAPGKVKLEIFNVLGRKVRTLVDEVRSAGKQSVRWDGTDAKGRPVGSGVYFYRLRVRDKVRTRKLVLLK